MNKKVLLIVSVFLLMVVGYSVVSANGSWSLIKHESYDFVSSSPFEFDSVSEELEEGNRVDLTLSTTGYTWIDLVDNETFYGFYYEPYALNVVIHLYMATNSTETATFIVPHDSNWHFVVRAAEQTTSELTIDIYEWIEEPVLPVFFIIEIVLVTAAVIEGIIIAALAALLAKRRTQRM